MTRNALAAVLACLVLPAGALAGPWLAAALIVSGVSTPMVVDDAVTLTRIARRGDVIALDLAVDTASFAGFDADRARAHLVERLCGHAALGDYVSRGGALAPAVFDRAGRRLFDAEIRRCP